jgi:hypothetical protein
MKIGSVAPVQPIGIFYPPVQSIRSRGLSPELLQRNAVRAPAALRAVRSIEASEVTLRKEVYLSRLSDGRHDGTGMKRKDVWSYSYVFALYLYSRDIVLPRTGDSQVMN